MSAVSRDGLKDTVERLKASGAAAGSGIFSAKALIEEGRR